MVGSYKTDKTNFEEDWKSLSDYDDHFRSSDPSDELLKAHEEMLKQSVSKLNEEYSGSLIGKKYMERLKIISESYGMEGPSFQSADLGTKILELGFGVRATNALASLFSSKPLVSYGRRFDRNIDWRNVTLGDITELSKNQMRKYRNLGEKTVDEIEEIVNDLGHQLRED